MPTPILIAPPPARAPRTGLDLYALGGAAAGAAYVRPSRELRVPPDDYAVDQDTVPEVLAATLVDDFERYYLPFLERLRDAAGVREALGV